MKLLINVDNKEKNVTLKYGKIEKNTSIKIKLFALDSCLLFLRLKHKCSAYKIRLVN